MLFLVTAEKTNQRATLGGERRSWNIRFQGNRPEPLALETADRQLNVAGRQVPDDARAAGGTAERLGPRERHDAPATTGELPAVRFARVSPIRVRAHGST